jgi:membrane-bound lytic murein transglycosylase A
MMIQAPESMKVCSLGHETKGAHMIRRVGCALVPLAAAAALLAGCSTEPPTTLSACAPPAAVAQTCPACPACLPSPPAPSPPKANVLEPVEFADLPGWIEETFTDSLPGLRAACARFRTQSTWQPACAAAGSLDSSPGSSAGVLRDYFERYFTPWRASTPEGKVSGLMTGYYEPLLRGSRVKHGPYQVPLYAPPDDLLVIDLASINPELRNMRLRGRLEGRRVVPYYSRTEIERGAAPVAGKEILWVEDPVEAFFLQIQGSGRVQLDSGELVRIGYSDQNGHPYVSVGRVLIDRGDLQPGEASMQGIQGWARSHPERLSEMLDQNPSYVFFRELPASANPSLGPPGAIGVPLVPMRSIAVDPRFIALGAPVFLATTWPSSEAPLERLVFAQDTGGAIRGPVRADLFWGFGNDAGQQAGRMRQSGRLWLLWPKGALPPRPQP